MIEILPTENDDKDFIKLISQIINNSVLLYKPEEIYIVKIEHWFDFKWLGFSGKTLGVIPRWNRRLTIPAFNPNRVLEETFYKRENNSFIERESVKLHNRKYSGDNLQNFIDRISEFGMFVWYSGNTNILDKASLMIYRTNQESKLESKSHINDWYVSFQKNPLWKLYKTIGISQNEFSILLENIKDDKIKRILSPHLTKKSDAKKFVKIVEEEL